MDVSAVAICRVCLRKESLCIAVFDSRAPLEEQPVVGAKVRMLLEELGEGVGVTSVPR